jgi:pimeloyl-ACP methyl ester carboxylesterase
LIGLGEHRQKAPGDHRKCGLYKMSETYEPHSGTIDVADARLHYLDWGGCGTPAHLLHANGFCAGTYAPFVRYLTGNFKIVASDVRGHGDSLNFNTSRISHWQLFAKDLCAVISATLPPPVVGMGHSLGAVATMMAAIERPEMFAGIVMIEPPILPYHTIWLLRVMRWLGIEGLIPLAKGARRRRQVFRSKQAALKRFTSNRGLFKKWSPEFIDAYLECGLLQKDARSAVLKCDPELEAQIYESNPTHIWRQVPRVACPTLIIRGAQSDILSEETARRLIRLIPDAQLDTIAGSGHFPPMERPRECAHAITEFMQLRVPPLNSCLA